MTTLPSYIGITFIVSCLLIIYLFYRATARSTITLIILLAWLAIQGAIGYSGFYTITDTVPPRFILIVLPPLITIVILFATKAGLRYIDRLSLSALTFFHVVRIPVEIVLYWLLLYKTVPPQMTFEGNNFDIFSGLTAPLVYYFGFNKEMMNRNIILAWNIICLGLLLNVVITGILSAPTPFQQIAMDQPNIALLHFPFNWLPCLVPLVLFAHLVSIRQLIRNRSVIHPETVN